MPKCIILVGVPASGKSYWTSQAVLEGDIDNCRVLSTDDIIDEIAVQHDMTYTDAFPHLIDFAQKAFELQLEDAVLNRKNVIIDRTNLTPTSRKKIMDMVNHYSMVKYDFEAVVFETPEEEVHEKRLFERFNKVIPDNVIQNMKKSFTVPTEAEGFSDIKVIEAENELGWDGRITVVE